MLSSASFVKGKGRIMISRKAGIIFHDAKKSIVFYFFTNTHTSIKILAFCCCFFPLYFDLLLLFFPHLVIVLRSVENLARKLL